METRLTIGVLITEIAKAGFKATNKSQGNNIDKFPYKDQLVRLIKLYNPMYQESASDSFGTQISNLKNCLRNPANEFDFYNTQLLGSFNFNVESDNFYCLRYLNDFVNEFIDYDNKGMWLTYELLTIIKNDPTIPDDYEFFGEEKITKKDLLQTKAISLEAVILLCWHYLMNNESVKNTDGRDTIELIKSNKLKAEDFKIQIDYIANLLPHDVKKSEPRIVIADNGIAPEITTDNDFYVAINEEVPDIKELKVKTEIDLYLEELKSKNSTIKTLLYKSTPQPFYDFYVANHLTYKKPGIKDYLALNKVDLNSVRDISNMVIITGLGGMGKSMMMRHLLLNAIDTYETNQLLPIFISVKDYGQKNMEIKDYVFSKLSVYFRDFSYERYQNMLFKGQLLLLVDGLDEISNDQRINFKREFEDFTTSYSKNVFIMTSRPLHSALSFTGFTVVHICPFTLDQSIKLLNKLEYDEDVKLKFINRIKSKYKKTHREFIENPLLLTMMLITFNDCADIPDAMHLFYNKAFVTLAETHDSFNKQGFSRESKTGLSTVGYSEYLQEICTKFYLSEARSYNTFSESDFTMLFNSSNIVKKKNPQFSASDLLYDLVNNVCIMFYEDGAYHFIHRSFQEYFVALYISNQPDKFLYPVAEIYEKQRIYGDSSFGMLCNMIPERMEMGVFYPFLKDMLSKYETADDAYISFLIDCYPTINYATGDEHGEIETTSSSFIYDYICKNKHLRPHYYRLELPHEDDFVSEEYVYVPIGQDQYGDYQDELKAKNECTDQELQFAGDPEAWDLELEVERVIEDNREWYAELYDAITADNFPFKLEYENLLKYFEEIKDKAEKGSDASSVLSMLGL